MTKAAITKGLLGMILTETLNGKMAMKSTITDVTFPNEGSMRLFLKGITIPLTLPLDTAIELVEKGTVSYQSAKGNQVTLTVGVVEKKTKKAK